MSRRAGLRSTVGLLLLVMVAACGGTNEEKPPAPPSPPKSGALFGAYVDPVQYTDQKRIDAVLDFESLINRRLDIVHDFHTWRDPFPSKTDIYFARRGTLVLLSWAGTDTDAIAAGSYDTLIRQRAEDLAALNRPVLLEWRWEMNRPNLVGEVHSGAQYVAAWRHIHDIFDEVGVPEVRWVWCPLSDQEFSAYYPGDDYVDWIGADGYARNDAQSFAEVFAPFMQWAKSVPKPIIIGEFGRQARAPGSRARWLDEARAYVKEHPQIKAVSYFESARGSSGAYAVASESSALEAMRDWAHDPYFSRGTKD